MMEVNISDKTSIMSAMDWNNARRLLLLHAGHLASTHGEHVVLTHVAGRTIQFHKLSELFRTEWLVSGHKKLAIPPSGLNRQAVWRSRRSLTERGVLLFTRRGYDGDSALTVHFNLPGTARYIGSLWRTMMKNDSDLRPLVEQLERIAVNSAKLWEKLNLGPVEVKPMASMHALIEEGYERSREARMKIRARQKDKSSLFLRGKAKLGSTWVFQTMEDICGELGMTYYDGLTTDKEWKVARGSARNFLSYCQRDGKNPYDILYSVVENWMNFNHKVLTMKNGEPALFSNVVDFMTFFRYRDQIMQFILQQEKTGPEPAPSDSSSSDIDAELAAFAARPDFY
jgi:hypothetical protein